MTIEVPDSTFPKDATNAAWQKAKSKLDKLKAAMRVTGLGNALKGVLARADQTPTLIFDEIDQGIGGRVGTIVGQKLWSLGGSHQVLCITHLPQLAGFGDQHFKVEKAFQGGAR